MWRGCSQNWVIIFLDYNFNNYNKNKLVMKGVLTHEAQETESANETIKLGQ